MFVDLPYQQLGGLMIRDSCCLLVNLLVNAWEWFLGLPLLRRT